MGIECTDGDAAQKLKQARAEKRKAAALAAASIGTAMQMPVGSTPDPEAAAMFTQATQMFTVSVGDIRLPPNVYMTGLGGMKRPREQVCRS